jgi:hypothetical protein
MHPAIDLVAYQPLRRPARRARLALWVAILIAVGAARLAGSSGPHRLGGLTRSGLAGLARSWLGQPDRQDPAAPHGPQEWAGGN